MDSMAQSNPLGCDTQGIVTKNGALLRNVGFPPESIWILGAGRFGRIAAERLLGRYPKTNLLVVDQQPQRLMELHEALGIPVYQEDAIAFIHHRPLAENQWIVPAVPVHVAGLWLMQVLGRDGAVQSLSVPTAVDEQVPNPYRAATGTLYASFATFVCPDACSEPEELCTYTGQPRPGNLFERLALIQVPEFRVEVVRSWQLAPGVGGYRGGQLHAAAQLVHDRPGRWIIATSCRCHAVIDALVFQQC